MESIRNDKLRAAAQTIYSSIHKTVWKLSHINKWRVLSTNVVVTVGVENVEEESDTYGYMELWM